MQTKQLNDQLYSIIIQLDGNHICFAKDVTKADAEKMAIELKKTVVGEIEIAANKRSPMTTHR